MLSVIIPVYNTEKYLKKCLDSVINQTIKNIEIICVNDGSLDNSLNILNEYQHKDSRIKIINKKNGGLSSARNRGIEQATGTYITFLDSDDFIELNTYELALPYFKIEHVDLVHFSTNLVLENENCKKYNQTYFEHKYSGLKTLTDDIINNMDVCAWNKLYKLSIIKKYNIRFPEGLLYEDNPFFLSYSFMSRSVYFMDEKLYNYLSRENSIMNLTLQKNNDKLKSLSNGLYRLLCFQYLLTFVFKWNIFQQHQALLEMSFEEKFWQEVFFTSKRHRLELLMKATDIVNHFSLTHYYPKNTLITALSTKQYYKINNISTLTKRQRLFGVYKTKHHYMICFFGIKIKLKIKNQ